MADDPTQDPKIDRDGTDSPAAKPGDSTSPKMVPESDLIAVKEGAAKTKTELDTTIAGLKQDIDARQTSITEAVARAETADAALTKANTTLAELEGVPEKLAASDKAVEALTARISGDVKSQLKEKGMEDSDLEGKSLSELELMLTAALKVSPSTDSDNGRKRFDGGGDSGAGAGNNGVTTPYDNSLKEIESLKKAQGVAN